VGKLSNRHEKEQALTCDTSQQKKCKVFKNKSLYKYGDAWVCGFVEKKEVDEPYVKSSNPGVSKNGFHGFYQVTTLGDCLENSFNCN